MARASVTFTGVLTALVTPFNEDKTLDVESFEKIVDSQIAAGIDTICPLGSTGEAASLNAEEKEILVKICVEKVKGTNTKLVVGVGSNNTETVVENIERLKKYNIDGVLVVTPFYSKPSQRGVVKHFQRVNEAGVPIIVYNNPGRTGTPISAETMKEIYETCPNVVALKDASGSIAATMAFQNACGIPIISGMDIFAVPMMSIGCAGVFTIAGNFLPELPKKLISKDSEEALKTLKENYSLLKNMFLEPNPVAVKHIMFCMGLISSPAVRLPNVELQEDNKVKIKALLQKMKLI